MKSARIINAIFWLYLWLSDVMQPVVFNQEHFWAEKGRQLFRLNSHVDDLPRLLGNAVIPLVLWFVIDWVLRRAARPKTTDQSVGL
jgi:hypothetical protein